MTIRLGIILLPLIAPAVLLPLAACTDNEIETNVALLRGDPPPDAGMYMAEIPASSEEDVAAVEAASSETVEPEPVIEAPLPSSEDCPINIWRGNQYDCHGVNLGPIE